MTKRPRSKRAQVKHPGAKGACSIKLYCLDDSESLVYTSESAFMTIIERIWRVRLMDLSALVELDDEPFTEVVKETFRVLTRDAADSESVIEGHLGSLGPLRGKQAYAALTSSILEAARADHDAAQLQSSLEDAGLGPDQCKVLIIAYEASRPKLREILGRIGYNALELVGVDWRLDYHIKSSVTGNDNEPVYYVTVKTMDKENKQQDIQMACTLEELQDFRAKVKDAVKQAERILASRLDD